MPTPTENITSIPESQSVISAVFLSIRNYCKALRSGPATSPEAAEQYARIEAEFEHREREVAGK